jgi:hypothetical protein
MKRGAPIDSINSVGLRKIPRPAVAALRMTSGWEIILKLSHCPRSRQRDGRSAR